MVKPTATPAAETSESGETNGSVDVVLEEMDPVKMVEQGFGVPLETLYRLAVKTNLLSAKCRRLTTNVCCWLRT